MSKKDKKNIEDEAVMNEDTVNEACDAESNECECEGVCECEADENAEAETCSGTADTKKDALIADLQDRVKRQMAEFDNYRKRTEKEKSAMFEMGASDVVKKLLPIVDNFERGFKSVSEEELETPFAKGMDMVYKQTMKMLEDISVKPIEAVGQEFNPELHNAVMHVEDDSVGENIIVEEFEKGYTYRDTVIRHSMVKVAN